MQYEIGSFKEENNQTNNVANALENDPDVNPFAITNNEISSILDDIDFQTHGPYEDYAVVMEKHDQERFVPSKKIERILKKLPPIK